MSRQRIEGKEEETRRKIETYWIVLELNRNERAIRKMVDSARRTGTEEPGSGLGLRLKR